MKNGRKEMSRVPKVECDQCQIEMPLVTEGCGGIEGGVFVFEDSEGNEDAMCVFCEDVYCGTEYVEKYVREFGYAEFDERFGWRHRGNVPVELREEV